MNQLVANALATAANSPDQRSRMPEQVLLQSLPSAEARTIRHACMLLDGVQLTSAPLEAIERFRDALASGRMMPVGSVEFVRAAMQIAGVKEPQQDCYPVPLRRLLHRPVHLRRLADLADQAEPCFIKPAKVTKLFSGFIWRPDTDASELSEHDREQLQAISGLPIQTTIWVSPHVDFISEVRYYVIDGRIAGHARYDLDGADDAPLPDREVVEQAVAALAWRHPHTLDMGVLASGATALVEAHHAWSIGLYGSAMEPRAYYRMLRGYWDHLLGLCEPAATQAA
jgi:hypothetical protein